MLKKFSRQWDISHLKIMLLKIRMEIIAKIIIVLMQMNLIRVGNTKNTILYYELLHAYSFKNAAINCNIIIHVWKEYVVQERHRDLRIIHRSSSPASKRRTDSDKIYSVVGVVAECIMYYCEGNLSSYAKMEIALKMQTCLEPSYKGKNLKIQHCT